MIEYEDECCNCATETYPCIGEECKRRNVPHYYCDECEEEYEEIFHFNNQELCINCIKNQLDVVKSEK